MTTTSSVKTRIIAMYALLAGLNIGAWIWALAAFHNYPVLLGTALLAYSFGLRHAVDADHIAAIDNVTRKLMQEGKRPVGVGFYFSLGHSTIVFGLSIVIALTSVALKDKFDSLESIGGIIGTLVSAFFLLVIAIANIFILISVYRTFQHVKSGGTYVDEDLNLILSKRGFFGRIFRNLFRLVAHSWQMYPVGFLFGLGFDTATEVGLLGISATAAAKGLPIWSILVFPTLFTAGMALIDATDSILMLGAYGWAFVKPIRKLYYNMTITLVSILVALFIGGIEVLGLVGDELGLKGGFWETMDSLNDNFGIIGFVIIGIFVVSWCVSLLVYRLNKYDEIEVRTGISSEKVLQIILVSGAFLLIGSPLFAQNTGNTPPPSTASPAPGKTPPANKSTTPAKMPSLTAKPAKTNSNSASATPASSSTLVPTMPTIVVTGLIGLESQPTSASSGVISSQDLEDRPTQRVGDLLETVPGLVVTQHAGGGKANQYYLRGFNLDHGTDLNTSVDGVPVNMGTHAHGQGYDDINFVIPELIESIDFRKGPYYADVGDFGNAGTISINYVKSLPADILVLEGGGYDYERALYAGSRAVGPGNILLALEASHDGGAWKSPDDYRKLNGIIKYSQGDENEGFSFTAQAYNGQWNASDEYPQSLYESGQISRFEGLDPSDGGASSRESIYGEWHQKDEDSSSDITVYGVHYYMNIYSDFTFFLNNPVNGDQFRQYDSRYIAGLHSSHSWYGKLGDMNMTNTVGFQARNDDIDLGLYNTEDRQVLNTVRRDSVLVTNLSPYYDNKIEWTDWLRTDFGLRGDLFYYDDSSSNPLNTGTSLDLQPSPKFSITFGPWDKTEIYVDTGEGLRSNDARGIISTVDPTTGAPVIKNHPIVQTMGGEIGVRTKYFPGWESDLSFWVLHSQSELFFDGDVGANDDSDRPGFRYGVEWSNHYSPCDWLTLQDTVAFSRSQFTDNNQTEGLYIPEAIESMASASFTIHNLSFAKGFSYTMDMRYMGPRALTEDNSERSERVLVFNARTAYDVNKNVSLFLDFLNLTNSRSYDAEYYYASAYPRGAAPINDFQVHPIEPFNMRGGVTFHF